MTSSLCFPEHFFSLIEIEGGFFMECFKHNRRRLCSKLFPTFMFVDGSDKLQASSFISISSVDPICIVGLEFWFDDKL